MKKTVFLLLLPCFISIGLYAQNYTWLRGSYLGGTVTGVYGTQNIASPGNDPGCRHGSATWIDKAGNLWMHGGEGYSSINTFSWLSDLWKYDITTNQWTWIRGSNGPDAPGVYGTLGVPSPSNEPGAREFSVSWTDSLGNFWLFGGDGFDANANFGRLADLWKYDPVNDLWTWMHGFNTVDQNGVYGSIGVSSPLNMPGARYGAATWYDNAGMLWLYGGRGFSAAGPSGFLNDLWRYNPQSNQWTWMKGTNQFAQPGDYGSYQVTAPSNHPGGREFPNFWKSLTGDLYLHAGLGVPATGPGAGYLNDLWKYEIATNSWTWIHGDSITNQNGIYGTINVPSPSNKPGGRTGGASWTDLSGKLWTFGGVGFSAAGVGKMSDLFMYDPSINQWTHMKGTGLHDQFGSYGVQGVADPANNPGGRYYNTWWRDNDGDFWLFGALGFDSLTNAVYNMNDLWKFKPPCNPDSIHLSPQGTLCSGTAVTFTAYNQFGGQVNWYSSPTSTASIGTGSTLSTPPLIAIGSTSVYTFYAETNACKMNPRTSASIIINPPPQIIVSGDTLVCTGTQVSLTASGAASYTWITGQHASGIVLTPTVNQNLVILGLSSAGCQGSGSHQLNVKPLPVVSINASEAEICLGNTVTYTAAGASTYTWQGGSTSSVSSFTPNVSGSYSVTGTGTNNCSNFSSVSVTVSLCSGLNEKIITNIPEIYPNPFQGAFILNYDDQSGPAILRLYDLGGKVVFEQQIFGGIQVVNCALPAGLYCYCISTQAGDLKRGVIVSAER